jgi:hypothetical protein
MKGTAKLMSYMENAGIEAVYLTEDEVLVEMIKDESGYFIIEQSEGKTLIFKTKPN